MFVFLTKFIPLFIYPIGSAFLLLLLGLIFSKKTKTFKMAVLLAVIFIWLGGNNWVSKSLSRSLEWRYFPRSEYPSADVIVVLSGGTDPAQYPRPITELNGAGDRVLYAAQLYHQGVAPKLLLTGGFIPWRSKRIASPAAEMAEILAMLSVPMEALWLEHESVNTYENALFSKDILEEKGIKKIILVTSASHMRRSVALFEQQGFEVIPAPTDYSVTENSWNQLWEPKLVTQIFNILPTAENLSETTKILKEYFGFWVYGLRGWL
jgi:uncharacterized SAM-binding protein YcdF (DUF218 family)